MNQRHLLVGPLHVAAYLAFDNADLPYQIIFQLGRLLSGVFLAGIVARLGGGFALAVCAGLALSFTSLRVDHLYQSINWHVEPTLPLLLASAYFYIWSVQASARASRSRALYVLSFALYAVSVLLYESGLPWFALNVMLSLWLRRSQAWRLRLWHTAVEIAPFAITAALLAVIVLFGMTPWEGLRPSVTGSLGSLVRLAGGPTDFPERHLEALRTLIRYGDRALVIMLWVAGALMAIALSAFRIRSGQTTVLPLRLRRYAGFAWLALFMIVLSGLATIGSAQITDEYLDRIQFGQAAGIALLSCVALFALGDLLAASIRRFRGRDSALGAALCAALLVGPGLALTVSYRDFAAKARAEIDHLTEAILQIRPLLGRPLHLVVVTDPAWPAARFLNASDVILHEVQQAVWARGGDATLDLLKVGGLPDQYLTQPGSCDALYGEASAGPCIATDRLMGSRWAAAQSVPIEDVVVVRYDAQSHTLRPVSEVPLRALEGYNIGTAGPQSLKSSPARLLVPIDQFP